MSDSARRNSCRNHFSVLVLVLVVVLPLVLEFSKRDEGEDEDEVIWLRPNVALCSQCPRW